MACKRSSPSDSGEYQLNSLDLSQSLTPGSRVSTPPIETVKASRKRPETFADKKPNFLAFCNRLQCPRICQSAIVITVVPECLSRPYMRPCGKRRRKCNA